MRLAYKLFLISQIFVLNPIGYAKTNCSDLFLDQKPDLTTALTEYKNVAVRISNQFLELDKLPNDSSAQIKKNLLTERFAALANQILDEALPRGKFDPGQLSQDQVNLINLIGQMNIHSKFDPFLGIEVESPAPVTDPRHFTQIFQRLVVVRMNLLSPAIRGFQPDSAPDKNQKSEVSSQKSIIGFLGGPQNNYGQFVHVPVWDISGGQVNIVKIPKDEKQNLKIGFTIH